MAITKEQKTQIIQQFRCNDRDTGSPEVQIALFTARINELTEHLKQHRKDFSSRRGLLMLVSKRNRLLRYIRDKAPQRYLALVQRLGLRK
jgi:small subunit ribosomal protein S15